MKIWTSLNRPWVRQLFHRSIVRINDRGPWGKGRIIDISYAAAREIGMHRSGTARVKLELLD